jgi:hypothetical protein
MEHGDWAWCIIAAGITAYELKAPSGQLLSQAVSKYRQHHPIITDVAIIYIAAHLLRRWPPRIDPLHLLGARMGR